MKIVTYYFMINTNLSPVQTSKFSLTRIICWCLREKIDNFLDNDPGLKASRTSFLTRKLASVYVQQRTLDKGIFVKKKYCQISHTQEQTMSARENLSRETCSSYRRVSEFVKKLVKENLLVCTGL